MELELCAFQHMGGMGTGWMHVLEEEWLDLLKCLVHLLFRNGTFYLYADALNPVDCDLLAYLRVFSMDKG